MASKYNSVILTYSTSYIRCRRTYSMLGDALIPAIIVAAIYAGIIGIIIISIMAGCHVILGMSCEEAFRLAVDAADKGD